MLKEAARKVDFDLSARAEYRIPERMERTVYVSPLAANVTLEMVKVVKFIRCTYKCTCLSSVLVS